MQVIKMVSKRIKEELHDAEWYAKAAIECKEVQPTLASVYYRLAGEEINHANMLHTEVVQIIQAYDKPVPPVMEELWKWQHEEMVEQERDVRRMLDMYKR